MVGLGEHVGPLCVEADITILVKRCPDPNHRNGDFSFIKPATDAGLDKLLVVGTESVGPAIHDRKDEILSLDRQGAPEHEKPSLSVILHEIAREWRKAWRDEIVD